MAAHAVAGDALPRHIGGEIGGDDIGQFSLNIIAHPVMLGIWLLRRIDVETCTKPEIISTLGVISHAFTARAGVGCDKDQPKFSTRLPKFALVSDVGMGAGEARKIPDNRQFRPWLVRRHED